MEEEGCISDRTRKNTFVFGGRIDMSVGEGNYDAELTAIARGLMCIPVGCCCALHTDSQSSIQAIKAYRSLPVHAYRRRLRMPGRPLLALIGKVMSEKEAAGGAVELRWVKAHTKGRTIHDVGNRLADDYAGAICDEKMSTTLRHKVNSTLPLELHERFVVLRICDADGAARERSEDGDSKRGGDDSSSKAGGRVLTKDPRRAAWRAMTQQCMEAWASSFSQSLYCNKNNGDNVDAHGLWQFAAQHMPATCGFVVLALANAWQWRRTYVKRHVEGDPAAAARGSARVC